MPRVPRRMPLEKTLRANLRVDTSLRMLAMADIAVVVAMAVVAMVEAAGVAMVVVEGARSISGHRFYSLPCTKMGMQ